MRDLGEREAVVRGGEGRGVAPGATRWRLDGLARGGPPPTAHGFESQSTGGAGAEEWS